MKILDELIGSLQHKETPVNGVWSGAFWTAVTSRNTGLSTTYRDLDPQHSDQPKMVPRAGQLTGMTAGDLALYAKSEHTVSASIGMATINSLIDIDASRCQELNAFDVLVEKGKGRNVGIVGHFPFVPKLREFAGNLWVVEKRLRPGDLPEEDSEDILPRCEVVCLTSSSFINHTVEHLLELCKDAFVVLTGPTSPVTPLLFDYGIDVICGSKVTDAGEVVRHISQGACFRQVKGHGVQLLAMSKDNG